jgi:glucose-6-phosphate dehydrogenase assembly protein OpcA
MANNIAGGPVKRLPWAGKQVRLEEVEATLSSLWKMSADNMRTGANLHVRTSVLNLVICTPNVESAQHASKLLRDLASTHIARATIVILDQSPEAPDALESWVTLRCFSMISDLMRHCFEQTTLLLSGRATRALGSTLPTVLKAHLPVYLWWLGDTRGADTRIFHAVAELCQRVIVDSATFLHPEQDIHTLAAYCKAVPNVAVSDLNWGRLTPWRQLVAQFFDVGEYLPFLAGIERIEITYAAPPNVARDPTGALLLAGWLKARLNMYLTVQRERNLRDTPDGTYQWLLALPDAEHETLLQIQPHVQADLQPGSICLVRLTCNADNRRAIFTIKRDADTDYVLTSVESLQETRPIRTVNLPNKHEESELLRKELEIMVHDQFFEQTLQELAMLIGEA